MSAVSSQSAPSSQSAASSQFADGTNGATWLAIEVRLAGHAHAVDAAPGFSAMELMRAAGVPVIAECGGAGVCATCHCRVPETWAGALPPPTDEEMDRLDAVPAADLRSRLSCQITMTDALDGLVLELQPDSVKTPRRLVAAE